MKSPGAASNPFPAPPGGGFCIRHISWVSSCQLSCRGLLPFGVRVACGVRFQLWLALGFDFVALALPVLIPWGFLDASLALRRLSVMLDGHSGCNIRHRKYLGVVSL